MTPARWSWTSRMKTWNFQLRLDHTPDDDEVEALYEAGLVEVSPDDAEAVRHLIDA